MGPVKSSLLYYREYLQMCMMPEACKGDVSHCACLAYLLATIIAKTYTAFQHLHGTNSDYSIHPHSQSSIFRKSTYTEHV